jgi:hypothetical protein
VSDNTTAYPAGHNLIYLAPCGVQSGAIKCGCNDEGECHIIKMLEEQTVEDDAEIARLKAALVAAADALDAAHTARPVGQDGSALMFAYYAARDAARKAAK